MGKANFVFLDTSIIVAALLSHSGGSARVIFEYAKEYQLAINDHVLDELIDLLHHKFAKRPNLENELFAMLALTQIETIPPPPLSKIRALYKVINKKDAPILATALQTCEYLLSLDNDFLNNRLRAYAYEYGLIICTPGEFLQRTNDNHP